MSMSTNNMITYSIQLFAGVYLFLYSLQPDKYYEDMYYFNLICLLGILLGQLMGYDNTNE